MDPRFQFRLDSWHVENRGLRPNDFSAYAGYHVIVFNLDEFPLFPSIITHASLVRGVVGCKLSDLLSQIPKIILAGANSVADQYNARGLQALGSNIVTYDGVVTGEFNIETDKLPSPETLILKAGARIMMVKNDEDKQWVIGTLGTVKRLGKDCIWVNLDYKEGEFEVLKTS